MCVNSNERMKMYELNWTKKIKQMFAQEKNEERKNLPF